ncbi:MAG: hypothetical protein IJZ10_06355 [Thermoguttaceae bacterium]|nr:hypothetical protein [Thermoguttaceae bacterium]
MQRINEPNLPRVAAGQSISAADWNRIVDRINAGAPATVRAKTPTARVESQIVQIANVGKRDVKFLQPVFATGVLRVAIPNDADGKPLSGKARFEAELNAALNGACVVEAKDAAESTGEFGTPDFEYTTDDLAFVALEPIPAGGVGRALAACGPIFFADALRGSGQKFALPYANGTGYFYRSADFGYRVVAETGGDYRRRVALLGYWKPEPELTAGEGISIEDGVISNALPSQYALVDGDILTRQITGPTKFDATYFEFSGNAANDKVRTTAPTRIAGEPIQGADVADWGVFIKVRQTTTAAPESLPTQSIEFLGLRTDSDARVKKISVGASNPVATIGGGPDATLTLKAPTMLTVVTGVSVDDDGLVTGVTTRQIWAYPV